MLLWTAEGSGPWCLSTKTSWLFLWLPSFLPRWPPISDLSPSSVLGNAFTLSLFSYTFLSSRIMFTPLEWGEGGRLCSVTFSRISCFLLLSLLVEGWKWSLFSFRNLVILSVAGSITRKKPPSKLKPSSPTLPYFREHKSSILVSNISSHSCPARHAVHTPR